MFIDPAAGGGTAVLATVASLMTVGYPVLDLAANEQAEDLLSEMLNEAGDLNLSFIHANGDPVAELLRIAGEVHADLIVVGESATISHRFVGSVGKRLASRRREPVIVIVPSDV